MSTENVRFGEEQVAPLATLYGRARDCWASEPILNDRTAARIVETIDYDFGRTGVTPSVAAVAAMRAKQLDDWVKAYLADVPEATVLHLACGLDGRANRIEPRRGVKWYDVDCPQVINLRRKFFTNSEGYRMIGASVAEADWLDEVVDTNPTIVVAEGLSRRLTEAQGQQLLQRLAARFPCGQFVFDAHSSLGVRLQRCSRRTDAEPRWSIDDPRVLEQWKPGLVCLNAMSGFEAAGREKLPWPSRMGARFALRVPALRKTNWLLRYRF